MKVSTPSRDDAMEDGTRLGEWLAGRWQMQRKTVDHVAGQTFHLDGICTFEPDGGAVLQRETGVLRLESGQTFSAEQSYIWRFSVKQVELFFNDKRPFLTLKRPFSLCDSLHLCGEDTYVAQYDFRESSQWSSTWHVTGPRKNYVMSNDYIRVLEPHGA